MLRALVVPILFAAACGDPRSNTTPAPGAAGKASEVTAAATKVRTVEGITEYRLANGLQVLLFPDPTQSTVTVNITYLVGSRHEGYGETGMAHLLEHMLFRSTVRHPDVPRVLGEHGADFNGTTSTDRTNYYETMPASKGNLEFAIELEADRMIHALISPDDLKAEFSVARNELEMGENDPAGILEERIASTAFLWHNYGKSVIGTRTDLERVPAAALKEFYQRYYEPDNAVLVVAGKFDDAAALASVGRTFGAIPRPARTLQPTYTVEPVQDGERTVTLRRNGDVHVIGLAYHTVGAAAPEFPAVAAAIDVLTHEPSGRLYRKLVESKLAASVGGSQSPYRDPYLASFNVKIRDAANADRAEKIAIDEIEQLGTSKIDDQEIERWRAAELKDLQLMMADSTKVAIVLSEAAALGDWRWLFAYRERIGKVTAADVQRVASAYFKPSNRTLGRFIPTKTPDRAPPTATPDIAALVDGVTGGAGEEPGEAFAATFENIMARTTYRQLDGGIHAALLPKKTRGRKVELQLALHWGDEPSLQGKAEIARLAVAMLVRGTAAKSQQAIEDLEDRLDSEISFEGGAEGVTLDVESLRDQLPAALELAVEMLRAPAFSAAQLEIVKQEQLAALEAQLSDPTEIASTALRQLMVKWPKTDPRYPRSARDQIAAIKKIRVADLKAFYKEFAGAGHGELAIVGDFDADATTGQLERLLAGWTSNHRYERLIAKPFFAPATTRSIAVDDKEMSIVIVGHDVAMTDADPDFAAWLLVGRILGIGGGSRLYKRLSDREGLSYSSMAWTDADAFDASGSFGALATVAPQNVVKAKAILLEEIARMVNGKLTADELQLAKDSLVQAQDTSLSDDSIVALMLRGELVTGRTPAWNLQLRRELEAVTVADVERVARKYLQPSRLVIVDAGASSEKAEPHL